MKISCQSCQAKYTIADEKVLGKIVKIRCKKCGATIVINGNEKTSTQAYDTGAAQQPFDYASQQGGEQWTVNVADGDQRTHDAARDRRRVPSGIVNDETYCWKDGMADWLPLREIPEISGSLAGGGAAPPRRRVVTTHLRPTISRRKRASARSSAARVAARHNLRTVARRSSVAALRRLRRRPRRVVKAVVAVAARTSSAAWRKPAASKT